MLSRHAKLNSSKEEDGQKPAGRGKVRRKRKTKTKKPKTRHLQKAGEKTVLWRAERQEGRFPRRFPQGQQSGCYLWKRF